ncbi:hypothetical protein PG989_011158 [Apiospora arundinis]
MGRIKKKGQSVCLTSESCVSGEESSPREPNNRKKANKSATASTTFYYAKDIQYLLHEPLLQKFRDQKALEKKISKALGRGDVTDAARLERNAARPEKTGRPPYTLDHLVRERYPTFVDALRDLDDALSMLFLFASLPSTPAVPAKMIARCERLCLEFQHYLIVSQSLRKSFLSIKGIYYQATIQGVDILWLVPYKFNQRVVGDIDFRIMGTFVQFYMTLLKFINFKLYSSVGLVYPAKFDQSRDESAAELGAFTLEGNAAKALADAAAQPQITNGESEKETDPKTQAAVNKLIKQMKDTGVDNQQEVATTSTDAEEAAIDKFEPAAPGGDILPQPVHSSGDPASLFANCTFFLSRETPRQPLEFILKAFGCKRVGWDAVLGDGAYTTNPEDPSITHQIVDRPIIQAAQDGNGDNQTAQKLGPNQRIPGRIYVQPQWVWDSVNDEELKRPDLYAPGAQLPPHLSPFVQSTHGGYDPTIPLEDQEPEEEALQDSDEELESDEDEEEEEEEEDEKAAGDLAVKAIKGAAADGMDVAGSDDDDEEEEGGDDTFGGFSEGEDADDAEADEEDPELQYQRELIAEMTGQPVAQKPALNPKAKAKADARKKLQAQAKEEAEDIERAKGMLSKKKRKLHEQMMYTNNKKSAEDQKLREKRRKLEKQKARQAPA